MKRKGLVLLLLAAVLLAGGGALYVSRRNQPKPLVLSGTIEARDVEVGSLLGGRVAKVLVEEGSQVKARQPVVQLETDLIDLQIQQQQSRVAQAKAALAKTLRGPRTEEIARARAAAQTAERERTRQSNLKEKGIVGQEAYDTAAMQATTTAQTLQELEKGSRPEDIAAAQAALEAEQRQLGYLERQREESVVEAPADGVIESMDLRPGDLVGPNQPVAKLLEPSQIWVRVYVPEPQLGRVRVGQKAAVRIDTFPKRDFPGKVVEIRTQSEYTPRNVQTLGQRMDQVFGVKVAIDPAPELRPGWRRPSSWKSRPPMADRGTRIRDRRRGRVARLRARPRARQGLAARAARRDLRPARTERIGQVDAHPDSLRAARPDRGPRVRGRPRRREAGRGGAAADRLRPAALFFVRGPHGPRKPGFLRVGLRSAPREAAGAARVGDRPDLDRSVPRAARGPALRRLEAAPRARGGSHARTARALPRRADRGDRPRRPARALEPAVHARGRGRHALRDDPLHGRGRAVRPRRLPLPLQDAGGGNAGRARRGSPRSRPRACAASRPRAPAASRRS